MEDELQVRHRGCNKLLESEGGVADRCEDVPSVANDQALPDIVCPEDQSLTPDLKTRRKLHLSTAEIFTIDAISAKSLSIRVKDDLSQSESTSVSDETPPSTPSTPVRSNNDLGIRRRRRSLQDSRVTSSSSPARDEPSKRHKKNMILKALNKTPPDVSTLRQLAISRGGLLDDSLRKRAWPCLLDINITAIPNKPDVATLHGHKDYEQVVLDVNRSLKRFPPGMQEEVRLSYQDQLVDCIMWVLVSHPELHYYQGFHDIVVTFLLVVDEDLTFAIMDKLCQNHLRDFMEVTMEKTNYILHYLFPLIGKADPKLRTFLEKSEVGTMFCLSWLITWYGHVLSDFKHIVRLYDFFMACHPLMPIYLAADIVLYREKDVMECICEMPYVHGLLSRIPQDLPFELLITQTGDLFLQYPPNVLEEEAQMQYELFVQEIQKRREEGMARRAAAAESAARKRSVGVAMAMPANQRTGVFARMTYFAVIGAFGAVAFALLRNSPRFEWSWTSNWWPV